MTRTRNADLSQAIRSGKAGLVRKLLAEDKSIISVDWGLGETWLHKAAEFDHPDVIQALVEAGIDINAVTDEPQTPLHVAALKGCVKVVTWLLGHGAKVNAGGGTYPTPLSCAASGNFEVVKLLVEHGADVNVCYDSPPRNALLLAREWKKVKTEKFLREHGALFPWELPEGAAARRRREEVVSHLKGALGALLPIEQEEGGSFQVWAFPPSRERDTVVLVTAGVSECRMPEEEPRHVEFLFELPAGWPVTKGALSGGKYGWPLRWLKLLGEQVAKDGLSVAEGHTFASEDPSEPLGPGIGMTGILLLRELREFGLMTRPGGVGVQFLSLFPIYREELALKEKKGVPALIKAFMEAGVPPIFDPARPCVVKEKGR